MTGNLCFNLQSRAETEMGGTQLMGGAKFENCKHRSTFYCHLVTLQGVNNYQAGITSLKFVEKKRTNCARQATV